MGQCPRASCCPPEGRRGPILGGGVSLGSRKGWRGMMTRGPQGSRDGRTWEGPWPGAGQALTWLWDVLVTPQTVVTTEREPGGWLVFCCQGTGS